MPNGLTYPDASLELLGELFREESKLFQGAHRIERVPTHEHLKALLDTAFFASIRHEEGRSVAFRLAYLSRERHAELGCDPFLFKVPVPLTPQNLAKLAPAFDLNSSYFGVAPAGDGTLQIWGVLHFGLRPPPDLDECTPCLNVIVRRPGVVTVRCFNRCFSYRYAHGDASLPRIVGAPRDIDELAAPVLGFARIEALGVPMLEHGHGGTIFAIPTGYDPAPLLRDAKYQADAACDILPRQEKADERRRDHRALDQAYAFIGGLTAVDGAVLVDSSLNVLAFGVFVAKPDDVPEVVWHEDGSNCDIGMLGARHRSAVWFCAACPVGRALLVSQDGDARLFVPKDGKIRVVRNLQAYWQIR